MTRDEHRAVINTIMGMIAPEHQADASAALTSLTDDYATMLTEQEGAQTQVKTLTANNEKLRAVNAELFLKVGTTEKKEEKQEEKKEDEKPLPFTDLFNEKGELI